MSLAKERELEQQKINSTQENILIPFLFHVERSSCVVNVSLADSVGSLERWTTLARADVSLLRSGSLCGCTADPNTRTYRR